MMDLDEVRLLLANSNLDVWSLIDTAIAFAAEDDGGEELRNRRDGIVERLYECSGLRCRNCEAFDRQRQPNGVDASASSRQRQSSPAVEDRRREVDGGVGSTPSHKSNCQNHDDEQEDLDPFGGLFDNDETAEILSIKTHLEDPDQSEESLVKLLQTLADMNITFKALQETDIGRNVNRLRKHSSGDIRRLVKQLVRKWKETVDEWVRVNQHEAGSSAFIAAEGDSPQQNITKNSYNGSHHQVPDFTYSPNPHTGSSSSDKNYSEAERKPKTVPNREAPSKPITVPASVPPPNRPSNKGSSIDMDRLNSARRRLQENYQEAQNAKKQRTIQVMDIHDIPKPKSAFFAKNKGGFQGRFHR